MEKGGRVWGNNDFHTPCVNLLKLTRILTLWQDEFRRLDSDNNGYLDDDEANDVMSKAFEANKTKKKPPKFIPKDEKKK